MAGNNLVYQTIQLNCDKEYQAEPLDFTGIRTIKLTDKPTDVQVWISSENTGTNLFPLINRGDGWVNIDEPLQNVYIYTKGTNIQGDQLVLNVTGQKDIFNYGNNSSERIDKVGLIEGFSPKAQMQLQNAIFNLWNPPKIIRSILLQGEYVKQTRVLTRVAVLPLGEEKIADLNLDDEKFYKLDFLGHIDIGSGDDDKDIGTATYGASASYHLCVFNNTNNATFTPIINDDNIQFDNIFSLNKRAWASDKDDLFDIFGGKYSSFRYTNARDLDVQDMYQDKGFNFLNNFILQGKIINKYENIMLAIQHANMQKTYLHSSLIINLYEMQDPTQWNN